MGGRFVGDQHHDQHVTNSSSLWVRRWQLGVRCAQWVRAVVAVVGTFIVTVVVIVVCVVFVVGDVFVVAIYVTVSVSVVSVGVVSVFAIVFTSLNIVVVVVVNFCFLIGEQFFSTRQEGLTNRTRGLFGSLLFKTALR